MGTAVAEHDLQSENARLSAENAALQESLKTLTQQLDWLKRQLFGSKSERRLDVDHSRQAELLAQLAVPEESIPEPATETISYQRRKKQRSAETVNDSGLRFDDTVPVKEITLSPEGLKDIPEDQCIRVGEKITLRLGQRPGSHVVLRYIRPVYKHKDNGELINTPAPAAVFDNTVADVSLLAGLLVDKFCYHLPLYRQHQRLADAGVKLSRSSLTDWVKRSAALLKPIADAQLRGLLQSKILAMDETPIKAGRQGKGKLKQGYYWPLYGEADEVSFLYAQDRGHAQVRRILGKDFKGTLLTDGYEAYAQYAKATAQVTHAQCWSHTRRHFEKAHEADPGAIDEALAIIGALYRHEQIIRDQNLSGQDKLKYRCKHSEPIVHAFWQWCDRQCHRPELIPTHPLSKALKYALSRRDALQVFLGDPNVQIDTNHLERALRSIPMGRKNWLFCWTEVGARDVGTIQSLLTTCRLQGVNPYTYLVDVLQRVGQHPASQVIELTPRIWKDKFADSPLTSDVSDNRKDCAD